MASDKRLICGRKTQKAKTKCTRRSKLIFRDEAVERKSEIEHRRSEKDMLKRQSMNETEK